MTIRRERINFFTPDLPLIGDPLGALALVNKIVASLQIRIQPFESTADVAEHRRARHALDTTADRVVHIAGCDCLGREMYRLLTRTAHSVKRDGRHLNRKTREQYSQSPNVSTLFAGLGNTTRYNVLDFSRFNLGSLDQPSRGGA